MSKSIPMPKIPVARPFFGVEEEQALVDALRSGWVSQGPRVAEFEKNFAEYVGARYAVALSSCTTALHLAMVTAGVHEGDEVICPSLSFIATANCIRYVGARPVFADIDRSTYNLDPNRVEAAITPHTRAILAVHQIGLPAPMRELADIAGRHGLVLIEDAACAIGSEYFGRKIGQPHSLMACFSFHPRKILSTGEGGMITTDDANLADRLRALRQHAMTTSDLTRHSATQVTIESYDEVGYNYRMTDLQAAVGLEQLRRLDSMLERRRHLAARYTAGLRETGWLTPPAEPVGVRHNFQSYMTRLAPNAPTTRDDLMQVLLDLGISTRRGIMASHLEAPYINDNWSRLLPETERATRETMILPLFHQMSEDEQDYILQCIAGVGR
ncbi:MAG TPA: DegT/DnrJ/EryC1/StrS family aminotransferase [Candidatus Angelobacter sp.]|nr:DegT/DnrJ/EryC1/StrS family aminotransferase [Candidatus Angelobacter sp.]